MARTTHFKRTFHEICRNCRGTGKVAFPTGLRNIVITCPVCNGQGMVKKTAEGDILIEPYTPEQYRQKGWHELSELEIGAVNERHAIRK